MARHRKSSHKKKRSSNKCPEPINTMLDLAAGLTLALIADDKEKKYHYKARGKINPYEASAFGMASGRIKSTEDLIRLGGMLGAAGAFDDDPDDPINYIESHPIRTNNNRYAWRLNCEDGSAYGIFPEGYETIQEYNKALHNEKYGWRDFCEDGSEYNLAPEDFETEEEYEAALEQAREAAESESDDIDEDIDDEMTIEVDGEEYKAGESIVIHLEDEDETQAGNTSPTSNLSPGTMADADPFADDDFHVYVYCLVKLPSADEPIYYRTEDHTLRRGNQVIVPCPGSGETVTGEIVSVEHHMRFSVPVPVEETRVIIGTI